MACLWRSSVQLMKGIVMRLSTIWTLPSLSTIERFRRTKEWSRLMTVALLQDMINKLDKQKQTRGQQTTLYTRSVILATKKQKREALRIKREAWLEDRRRTGIQALRADQENRKHKLRDSQREKHNKDHSWKVLIKDCILCQDRLEEARRQQKATETDNG